MNKINKDVAAVEVDKFLFQTKKINKEDLLNGLYGPYALQDYFDFIKDVANGYFVFEKDCVIQNLNFPVAKDQKELKYGHRLYARDLSRMAAYNQNDIEGRKRETIAILTGEASGIIGDLDSTDFERAKTLIEFYFLG